MSEPWRFAASLCAYVRITEDNLRAWLARRTMLTEKANTSGGSTGPRSVTGVAQTALATFQNALPPAGMRHACPRGPECQWNVVA